jgi:hypothetical protein
MNRPLTRIVGAFMLLIVAVLVAIGNFKPETKKTLNLKPQASTVEKIRHRQDQKTKKSERPEQPKEEGFRVVTRVSMYDPSSKTTTEN